jgi:hypothetical protein
MLERAMKLKDSLITFFTQYDSNLKNGGDLRLSLDAGAWKRFHTLYEFLQPFQEATVATCGDKYPTLSLVLPLYNAILDHVERWMKKTALEDTIVDKLHHACVASYSKMKNYYDLTSDVYTIATVLDPRFKLDYYKNQSGEGEDSATDIKAVVNQLYQQSYYSPPAITNHIITHTPTPLLGIFKKRTVSPHNEFEAYCQDPSQLEGGTMADVLSWWKAR